MRGLLINQQKIYYALYLGKREAQNQDALYTGDLVDIYDSPVEVMASVSAARGTSDIDLFGININYTHTVIVDHEDCPITETSRLWIGRDPNKDEHNFEVVRVARSLNHVVYAVQQVDYKGANT